MKQIRFRSFRDPDCLKMAMVQRGEGGRCISGNAFTLIVTATLFMGITGAQYVASLPRFANSLALRADCLSMFVDSCSYLGNLAAECNSDEGSKKSIELIVAGLSLSLLFGFTVAFFFEAVQRVAVPTGVVEQEVDPKIGEAHPQCTVGTSLTC